MLIVLTILLGFIIGCTVAATGIGGGVLLMPVLILALRIPPINAVGTALFFMAVTKAWATLIHWKQRTVDFRLAGQLAIGSVPGALIGSGIVGLLQFQFGEGFNHLLRMAIGVSLVLVASLSLMIDVLKGRYSVASRIDSRADNSHDLFRAVWVGLAGGLLVSVTSVGSGSFIIILLLIFCRRIPAVLVGTDIFHGLILATVAALAHLGIGRTDFRLVGLLLLGSMGGVLVGARISVRLAPLWLRRTLLVLAAAGGVTML